MLTKTVKKEYNVYMTWMQAVRRAVRAAYAEPCQECILQRPTCDPTKLLPSQVCAIHAYRDPRTELTREEWQSVIPYFPKTD